MTVFLSLTAEKQDSDCSASRPTWLAVCIHDRLLCAFRAYRW